MIRRLAHVALFLLGMLGASRALVCFDTIPFWSWSRNRHEHFAFRASEFNTLLIGTSRVNFGVVPADFDAAMSDLGHPTRTLNYAISGLRGADIETLVDWALRKKPASIRHFIVELCSYEQKRRGSNWMTDQDVEMHTLDSLSTRVAEVIASGRGLLADCESVAFIAAHTACNMLRIGQSPRIAKQALSQRAGHGHIAAIPDNGYIASDAAAAEDVRQSAHKLANEPGNHAGLLSYKFSAATQRSLAGGFPTARFLAMDRRIRDAGVVPVYVVMPTLYGDFHGNDVIRSLPAHLDVLDLDAKRLHDNHYQRDDWYDPGHLSRHGAKRFSAWLATLVAQTRTWKDAAGSLASVAPDSSRSTQPASLHAEWRGDAGNWLAEVKLVGMGDGDMALLGISDRAGEATFDGKKILLGFPLLSMAPMTAGDGGTWRTTLDARQLPSLDLYLQAAVFRDGMMIATTDQAALPPATR